MGHSGRKLTPKGVDLVKSSSDNGQILNIAIQLIDIGHAAGQVL